MKTTYTPKEDSIIMETLTNRGNNTQRSAALLARRKVFKATGKTCTVSAITGRYYSLKKNGYKPTFNLEKKPKKETVVTTTTSETITMNVRGVEITMVFK